MFIKILVLGIIVYLSSMLVANTFTLTTPDIGYKYTFHAVIVKYRFSIPTIILIRKIILSFMLLRKNKSIFLEILIISDISK